MRQGFIALFLICAEVAVANANDMSISFIGGVPHVQEERDVAMVSEHLRFRLFPGETTPLPEGVTCHPDEETEFPSTDPDDPRPWNCRLMRYYNGVRLEEPEWYLHRYQGLHAELTYTFRNQGEQARNLEIGLPWENNQLMLGLDWEDWGVDSDEDGVVDSCQRILESPADERDGWTATVELAYGAPQTEQRLSMGDSPTDFCDRADLFGILVEEVEEGNEEAAALLEQLRYHEDSRYPSNVPEVFAGCLELVRARAVDE